MGWVRWGDGQAAATTLRILEVAQVVGQFMGEVAGRPFLAGVFATTPYGAGGACSAAISGSRSVPMRATVVPTNTTVNPSRVRRVRLS